MDKCRSTSGIQTEAIEAFKSVLVQVPSLALIALSPFPTICLGIDEPAIPRRSIHSGISVISRI
jgi:hypothetical protein